LAFGSVVVVTVSASTTVNRICDVVLRDGVEASETRNVVRYEPAVVGVPVTLPVELTYRPGGRTPPASVHAYGGLPPCARNMMLTGVATLNGERFAVVITGVSMPVMENVLAVARAGREESVTLMVAELSP
jgi:hypothetical protein